jgi:hypothetical protein
LDCKAWERILIGGLLQEWQNSSLTTVLCLLSLAIVGLWQYGFSNFQERDKKSAGFFILRTLLYFKKLTW